MKTVKPKLFPASSLQAAARGLILVGIIFLQERYHISTSRSLVLPKVTLPNYVPEAQRLPCSNPTAYRLLGEQGEGSSQVSVEGGVCFDWQGGSLPKQNKEVLLHLSWLALKFQVCPKPSIPPYPNTILKQYSGCQGS